MICHCLKEGSPDQVNIIPKEKFLNVVFCNFNLKKLQIYSHSLVQNNYYYNNDTTFYYYLLQFVITVTKEAEKKTSDPKQMTPFSEKKKDKVFIFSL